MAGYALTTQVAPFTHMDLLVIWLLIHAGIKVKPC